MSLPRSAAVPPNPFALLVDPDAVLRAHERCSQREDIAKHVYRPLDKVAPGTPCEEGEEFTALVPAAYGALMERLDRLLDRGTVAEGCTSADE